jgi:quinone-modifying oxidoreductase subunit QmoB
MERIGVFFCGGCGIADALDLAALQGAASASAPALCTDHPNLCSPEGVGCIRTAIDEQGLGGVLVAACSHRAKQREFRFDPARVVVERVSLREQVVWSHPPKDEDTQALAEDLVKMGLVRLAKAQPPVPAPGAVERAVLVVGGGVAGLEAAAAAAGLGHPVVLVEARGALGGHAAGVRDRLPARPPYDALQPSPLPDRIAEVESLSGVRVLKSTKLKAIRGEPGRFEVEVETPGGAETLRATPGVSTTSATGAFRTS